MPVAEYEEIEITDDRVEFVEDRDQFVWTAPDEQWKAEIRLCRLEIPEGIAGFVCIVYEAEGDDWLEVDSTSVDYGIPAEEIAEFISDAIRKAIEARQAAQTPETETEQFTEDK